MICKNGIDFAHPGVRENLWRKPLQGRKRPRSAIAQDASDPPNALVTNKPVTRRRMPSFMFPACHTTFMALLGNSRPRQCTANLLFLLLGGAQRARHVSWRIWLCKPV